MTKEEIQSKREEILAEVLSTPYLKDIPYKLIESEAVPPPHSCAISCTHLSFAVAVI